MTRDEAIQVAREDAIQNKWAFIGEVAAKQRRACFGFGRRLWVIRSGVGYRGGNTWFVIDDATGVIERKGHIPY